MTVRLARPADVPAILEMIRELADYEQAREEAQATEEQLLGALFGPRPTVFGLVAEQDGEPVGFALWFVTFSTWLGRHGAYLEDLYVRAGARGQGHGRALLAELARVCVDRGYGRLEWTVLDWNESARALYRSVGAEPMEEWTVHRLTGASLTQLAAR